MDKHITLTGILNIVYRAWAAVWGLVLIALALGFETILYYVIRYGDVRYHEIPGFLLDILPYILFALGAMIAVVSIVGIVAGIGVLRRSEWARIVLLIVSFFNLLRVPLGTLLGGYSIWVLMNDETIRSFNPVVRKT